MSDTPAADDDSSEPDSAAAPSVWTRETAPQSSFTMRDVLIGLVIAVIGGLIAFGIPIALT